MPPRARHVLHSLARFLAACPARVWRIILRANTDPVDALLYADALSWLAFLLLTPTSAYGHAGLGSILAYKGVWVWPAAAAAAVTPLGWLSDRPPIHAGARIVQAMWWVYLAVATAIVAPAVVVFWLPALCCAICSVWIMAREGAGDLAAPQRG